MESRSAVHHGTTSYGKAAGIGVVLSLVVGVILLAFAWPSVLAEPKDLPIAVAGPDASVEQVESRVADQALTWDRVFTDVTAPLISLGSFSYRLRLRSSE